VDTYDEDSQTSVKVEWCQWCSILGVQHVILITPGEKVGFQKLIEDITIMRSLPKLGCGVLVGIWATLVVEFEAILREWDSARLLQYLAHYRVKCSYIRERPLEPVN
jgi:hypothetical protein